MPFSFLAFSSSKSSRSSSSSIRLSYRGLAFAHSHTSREIPIAAFFPFALAFVIAIWIAFLVQTCCHSSEPSRLGQEGVARQAEADVAGATGSRCLTSPPFL